jgi:tRNA threonylcarbamoyl adenosine modification protein (Sua5/YciO/YrdC/YwlC family)
MGRVARENRAPDYNSGMPPQFDRPTIVLSATDDSIHRAAAALRAGKLVVFPTETVYGLGADAENASAVRAMFAAKGRPADHPVIVHLAEVALIEQFAAEVPSAAWQLAAAFWPGPMTLVLRKEQRVNDLVTGGLPTVGLRSFPSRHWPCCKSSAARLPRPRPIVLVESAPRASSMCWTR